MLYVVPKTAPCSRIGSVDFTSSLQEIHTKKIKKTTDKNFPFMGKKLAAQR